MLLTKGGESLRSCGGSNFCPDQVLLSKTFHSTPGHRQKSLGRNSGVVGVKSGILNACDL